VKERKGKKKGSQKGPVRISWRKATLKISKMPYVRGRKVKNRRDDGKREERERKIHSQGKKKEGQRFQLKKNSPRSNAKYLGELESGKEKVGGSKEGSEEGKGYSKSV